jgi:DNA-binding MarR family transcriptional regulator
MLDRVLPRTLLALSKTYERTALSQLHSDGHDAIRLSHFAVFSYIGTGTVRVSELADRTQQTQQGMGKTLRELEILGYIERAIDSTDRRAKAIKLTDSGLKVANSIAKSYTKLKKQHAKQIGQANMDSLCSVLDDIVAEAKIETPAPFWSK